MLQLMPLVWGKAEQKLSFRRNMTMRGHFISLQGDQSCQFYHLMYIKGEAGIIGSQVKLDEFRIYLNVTP